MIKVYLTSKSGKHTAADLKLAELVTDIIDEEQSNFTIKPKQLDVVVFDEPNWLEYMPSNKVAIYGNKVKSSMGENRALLGIRKLYITSVLHSNKEEIRNLIKHELVHIHIDPHIKNRVSPHGKKFRDHAKSVGLTNGWETEEKYVDDRHWKLLTGNKK